MAAAGALNASLYAPPTPYLRGAARQTLASTPYGNLNNTTFSSLHNASVFARTQPALTWGTPRRADANLRYTKDRRGRGGGDYPLCCAIHTSIARPGPARPCFCFCCSILQQHGGGLDQSFAISAGIDERISRELLRLLAHLVIGLSEACAVSHPIPSRREPQLQSR
jgi:hypothetical protein